MKTRTAYRCVACGGVAPRWLGRCPGCDAWGTFVEALPASGRHDAPTDGPVRAARIADVPTGTAQPRPTGIGELDRVLGGGLVAGSVTLLAGEPGMGKSTLVLQALASLAERGARCLVVAAEESAGQVRRRAERLGALPSELFVAAGTDLAAVVDQIVTLAPVVVAVDSIQTVADPALAGVPGSVAQVRESAHRLVRVARERSTSVVLVGHVTKDGGVAGPRALEHVVDTVLSFEGDRHQAVRLLRALKHRFGATQELGVFEMTGDGLAEVPDVSSRFLADRRPRLAGSVVVPVMEGARPLLVEVQALVSPAGPATPRRFAPSVDSGRLALLLAVLRRHAGIDVSAADVYASVAGGLRVCEPGADLGLALAVAGAHLATALDPDTIVLGEVGLGGEIRAVPHTGRRLAEAARLGFRRAFVPQRSDDVPSSMEVVRVGELREAVTMALDQVPGRLAFGSVAPGRAVHAPPAGHDQARGELHVVH